MAGRIARSSDSVSGRSRHRIPALVTRGDRTVAPGVAEQIDTSLRTAGALWRACSWSSDAYALARNLEFVAASGGLPWRMLASVTPRLSELVATSGFEAAQVLISAWLAAPEQAVACAIQLMAMQRSDGSWPPSRVLLVPPRHGGGMAPAYCDDQASFTTHGPRFPCSGPWAVKREAFLHQRMRIPVI